MTYQPRHRMPSFEFIATDRVTPSRTVDFWRDLQDAEIFETRGGKAFLRAYRSLDVPGPGAKPIKTTPGPGHQPFDVTEETP